ncbi:MAG: hypothetical protein JW932_10365 [Deltaproteobacteria bacterium]|nr:hypothetical protein [Deltaproteobacteria bacterium]
MARIKIKDLPKDMKISKEELKVIYGGPSRRKEIDYDGLYTEILDLQDTKDTSASLIDMDI